MRIGRFKINLCVIALAAGVLIGTAPGRVLAAGQQTGGLQTTEDLEFTLPSGWYPQPVQAGPDVKGHFVYMRQGIPYCELYVSSTPLAGPKTLDQAFQEGLEKLKPALTNYQPLGTQKTQVAGQEAIVHDFRYFPGGGGVGFSARAFVFIANDSLHNFFFNTPTASFASLQGMFAQILGMIRVLPRAAAGAPGGAAAMTANPAGGNTVEENGIVFDLQPGWRPSNDAQGAKYRLYGPGGILIGSLFIFKPDDAIGMLGLFGTAESQLNSALEERKNEFFKSLGNYTPLGTVKTKFGGFDAIVHDLNFQQGAMKGAYRWYFVSIKETQDTGTTRYAPKVHEFGFMTTALNQYDGLKTQFDAIVNSVRMKGTPAPTPPAPAPQPGQPARPETAGPFRLPPTKPSTLSLPSLTGGTADPGIYQDPRGKFKIPLPQGAQLFRKDGDIAGYKIPALNASFQIWSLKSANEAEGLHESAVKGKTLNGQPVTAGVANREVTIRLYTGKDASGLDKAYVTAFFPGQGPLMLIEVPAKDYAGAQEWITAMIQGVRFLD